MKFNELMKDIRVEKEIIDRFLDMNEPNWAVFSPRTGYLLRTGMVKDGVDDSYSISTYRDFGERKMINYSQSPCRINTYGDSFTQCHQVNDGETWQEYLAAHFGEPIRNYGIGGFGVYQAYIRLQIYENDPLTSASNVILNIFDDDHYRSIDKWRWIRIGGFREEVRGNNPNYFHANPWDYVRINADTGRFEEHESICPTKESLYNLCDLSFIEEHFNNDIVAHCEQAKAGGEFNPMIIKDVGDQLGIKCDFSDADRSAKTAESVHTTYALKSSEFILEKTRDFAEAQNKKLLVIQSFGASNAYNAISGNERFDRTFCDYLKTEKYLVYDLFNAHKNDYKMYNMTYQEYLNHYFIWGCGHYNPKGNHFFAFDLKSTLINWLDPKPVTYTEGGIQSANMANLLA